MPLEYYPPVTNMLDRISEIDSLKTSVWSTHNTKQRAVYKNNKLSRILRSTFPNQNQNKVIRLITYFWFTIRVFIGLVLFNPKTICYYETYSVGPVYFYMRLFGKNKSLIIHYHEYFDQDWYNKGMLLVRYYYSLEKKWLLKKASWISHTNSFRRNLFIQDHPQLASEKVQVMPNYPPDEWSDYSRENIQLDLEPNILKIVYVGSLSLEDTYIEDFCTWVIANKEHVVFDIFSYNCKGSAAEYLNNLGAENINFFHKGIEYFDLPRLLSKYDIGIILYKGNSLNAKYCASNKLFEYLALGLEVWVSKEQLGTKPYLNDKTIPRVISCDYNNLDIDIIDSFKSSRTLPEESSKYKFSSASNEFVYFIQNLT